MSKAPIWPVATDALVADTTHLSTEEFGAYMLLMIAQWRSNGGRLPADESRLARMARLSPRAWERVRAALAELFDVSSDGWSQKRIAKDFASVSEKIELNRESGSRGGRAKAMKNNKTGLANAKVSPEKSASENVAIHEPYPYPDKKEEEDTSLRSDTPPPKARSKPKRKFERPAEPQGFEEFYTAFPRHVGRPDAAKAYSSALSRASPEVLLTGARRYAAERAGEDPAYTKHPATWLNKDGWLDEETPHGNVTHHTSDHRPLRGHQAFLAGGLLAIAGECGAAENVPEPRINPLRLAQAR